MGEDRESKLLIKFIQARKSGKSVYFDADEIADMLDSLAADNKADLFEDLLSLGMELHPDSLDIKIRNCRFMLHKGKYDEALKYSWAIGGEESEDIDILRLECLCNVSDYDTIMDYVNKLLSRDLSYIRNLLSFTATMLNDLHRFDEAVKFIDMAISHLGDDLFLKDEKAFAYEMLGKYSDAINILNEIIDINPYSFDRWFNLAHLYMLDEQIDKAIDAFDFALTCNSSKAYEVNVMKGYCQYILENYDETIRIYEKILEKVKPTDDKFKNHLLCVLGESYVYTLQFEKAYKVLRLFLDNGGEFLDPDMYQNYFFCCLEVGHPDEGLAVLHEGISYFRENIRLRTSLVMYLRKENRFDEAEIELKAMMKVLNKVPDKVKDKLNAPFKFTLNGLRGFFDKVDNVANNLPGMSMAEITWGIFNIKKLDKKPSMPGDLVFDNEEIIDEGFNEKEDSVDMPKMFDLNLFESQSLDGGMTRSLAEQYIQNAIHNN